MKLVKHTDERNILSLGRSDGEFVCVAQCIKTKYGLTWGQPFFFTLQFFERWNHYVYTFPAFHSSQQTQWNEADAITDNFIQTTVFNHLKPRLGALFKGMWERIKLLGWTWGRTWQRTWCRPWRMGGLIIQNTNNKEKKNNNNCYTSNYIHIVIVIVQLQGYIPFQVKWFWVNREACNMVAMPFP